MSESQSSPLLDIKNLSVHYGAIRALFDVSLSVYPGEIVTLLGANGAGKTTTLRAISGLVRDRSGSIVFNGHDLIKENYEAHSIVRMGLAHSPEGRRIFGNLTVDENLDMGAYIQNEQDIWTALALQT